MEDHGKMKKLAVATYLIFFLPFLTMAKNDSFVNYHFKQSVALVVAGLTGQGVISILGFWGLGYGLLIFLVYVLRALMVFGVIYGILNSLAGNTKPLPFVGKYAEKL